MSSPWPFFDLRITTPRLQLRLPRDHELEGLVRRARHDLLTPQERDFLGEWTQAPSPQFEQGFMRYHWANRANLQPDDWRLELGVYPNGVAEPVGMMGLNASEFAAKRSVNTGSWLLPDYRGQGLGREMRAGVLQLAFVVLGAQEARSSAHPANVRSLGVSRSLGYVPDGSQLIIGGRGQAIEAQRVLLRREAFCAREDIAISGIEDCLDLLGAVAPEQTP